MYKVSLDDKKLSVSEITKSVKISRLTFYECLKGRV